MSQKLEGTFGASIIWKGEATKNERKAETTKKSKEKISVENVKDEMASNFLTFSKSAKILLKFNTVSSLPV